MRKPRFWIGLGLALFASTGMNASDVVVADVRLEPITTCEALEQHIEDVAVQEMRALIEPNIKRVYARQRMRFGCATAEMAGSALDAPNQGGPAAYTTTNLQVSGVDEPDFVKNDATRLFVLTGRTLYVQKSWPAHELATVGTLQIEGWPREMLLDERDRIVVFSDVTPGVSRDRWSANCWGESCPVPRGTTTKITVVDVSELSEPKLLREDYLPGAYRSARRIGSSVRVVLQSDIGLPEGLRFYLDESEQQPGRTDRLVEIAAWEELMRKNEAIIRSNKLADWIAPAKRRSSDGRIHELPLECGGFSKPSGPTRLGLLTVATLDLDEHDGPVRREGVIAQTEEVYASPTALYVTNRHWSFDEEQQGGAATYIHKFDTTDPSRARYVASGTVEGAIVDQFSLDEYEGHLRVATNRNRVSRVFVLEHQGDRLEVVGASEDLAPGETLFSARFMGTRGYVVTAVVNIDPFFTIDLSDPTRPRKVGELELPGFSTYLHPIDEDHVLAIGRDGVGATKLSLFDVSDFAKPREKFQALVGDKGIWGESEAESDHRAFNYFPEKKLLALPHVSSSKTDLRLFRVDIDSGIAPVGALEMTDLYREWFDRRYFGFYWSPSVRRSVLADDFVYAISDAGIRTARIDALDWPLQTVLFPREEAP